MKLEGDTIIEDHKIIILAILDLRELKLSIQTNGKSIFTDIIIDLFLYKKEIENLNNTESLTNLKKAFIKHIIRLEINNKVYHNKYENISVRVSNKFTIGSWMEKIKQKDEYIVDTTNKRCMINLGGFILNNSGELTTRNQIRILKLSK